MHSHRYRTSNDYVLTPVFNSNYNFTTTFYLCYFTLIFLTEAPVCHHSVRVI
uniref:Uncharacterized protein n=1 Tax=Oryza brachyantha TaxID=4533 RepID=J3M6N1_ORYBR